MIRARFKVPGDDGRPILWPVKHPFWITGYGEDCVIVVAYADDEAEVLFYWPDAQNIDSDDAAEYVFTDRFVRPGWFQE